jgi:hypothetical protein
LERLTACWVRLCLALFQRLLAGSRMVCFADGIKAPKEGKQMPAVKSSGPGGRRFKSSLPDH